MAGLSVPEWRKVGVTVADVGFDSSTAGYVYSWSGERDGEEVSGYGEAETQELAWQRILEECSDE